MILLFGPALVVAVNVGLTEGNPIAWGMAVGFAAPIVAAFALLAAPVKQAPRKADPAKIARMEADLGIGDAGERAEQSRERHGCIDPDCPHEHYTVGGFGKRYCVPNEALTEPDITDTPEALHALETGCTTMLVPRSADHCPRPEGCVISHPCRKCGAPAGQVCVGEDDLMEMTF